MNNYIELFISKCIKSSRKERLKYEYNSTKKRASFIDHFNHDSYNYIYENKIIFFGKLQDCYDVVKPYDKEKLLVLSSKFDDEIMMNLEELLLYMEKEYMAIVAISNNIAIIKEEDECGKNIYILKFWCFIVINYKTISQTYDYLFFGFEVGKKLILDWYGNTSVKQYIKICL